MGMREYLFIRFRELKGKRKRLCLYEMTFPIIKIIWKDARTDIGGGQTLRQIKNSKLSETHTMGYLVHEDKEKIAICSFYHPTYDEEEYQDGFKYVLQGLLDYSISHCRNPKFPHLPIVFWDHHS